MPQVPPRRLLFSGPFHADHRARALDALSAHADGGARDILYVVASGAARRAAIRDLVARRRAVFGVRVVTLRSLPAELARRARTKEPRAINDVVDELLIEREIRVASEKRFGASTPVRGLASKAASTIDLLERTGATPEQLAEVLSREPHGDGARVLAKVWASLAVKRPRYGATSAGMLASADELLRGHATVLAGLDLLVLEDVPLLTTVEHSIVRSLVAAAPADAIAAHGYAAQLSGAPSTRSLERLRALAAWTEAECAPPAGSRDFVRRLFAPPSFADAQPLDQNREDVPSDRFAGTRLGTITRLEATGDLAEVRLAARAVRRHLDVGVRPEEVALVAHANVTRYRELVREVFGAAGIPVAIALPRTLADTGIGSVLLQLLELAILPDRMTRELSLAVARAPHVALDRYEADRLESRVLTHGYLGLDGWDALAVEALGERGANRVNRLKRAVAAARSAFGSAASPEQAARIARQMAKELRLVVNAYFARRRLARGPGADAAVATRGAVAVREDNQAWEEIETALDVTVPALLEIERGSVGQPGLAFAESWLAMLTRAMRSSSVMPERVPAHAVQFRGTGPGTSSPVRVTIVLGLLEKLFPRQPRQDPFLDDELRSALRATLGWELGTSVESTERERECFLRAVSSATEALYLSYAATDADGRPAVRSFFIDDLQAAVGDARQIPIERSGFATAIARVSDSASRSELLAAVSHDVWQYLPRNADAEPRRATAFRTLDALVARDTDLSVVRHGRRVSQRPVLEGALPASAPHHTLRLSASQLKTLSHCTYEHFVDKVLVPTALVAPEYNALSKGSLIHDAIMEWSTTLGGWMRGEAAIPELREWLSARIERWPAAKRGTESTRRATEGDRGRLEDLLRAELAHLERAGVARPAFAELAFGEELGERGPRDAASRAEPFEMSVPTSSGVVSVKFRGSMDRVDVVTVGGTRYGAVIDYKSGRTSSYYAKDMMKGTDLQLRLYLLVLERFWGITPVGALYLGFGDGVRRGAMRADLAHLFAGIDAKAVKLLPPDEWRTFVGETPELIAPLVDRLVRLDVTPAPRGHDCGFCDLQPICRYDRWAPEAAGV